MKHITMIYTLALTKKSDNLNDGDLLICPSNLQQYSGPVTEWVYGRMTSRGLESLTLTTLCLKLNLCPPLLCQMGVQPRLQQHLETKTKT